MPSQSRHPLELVVRCAGRQIACAMLRRGRHYSLGQHEGNDITIDEPSISSRHARLHVAAEGALSIEDLRSANGTFVDGQVAEGSTRVTLTSFVQLGNASLEFQRAGLPAAVFEYVSPHFLSPRHYEQGAMIARGGVSTIHQARDPSLERSVAVRTMQPACQRSPATIIRFIREAQIMAQLQHPNIPPVHELRMNDDGHLFYSTRLMEGCSLASVLEHFRDGREQEAVERWPLPMLLAAWQKAADAVAYAHSRGVLHCALRPENIILGDYGEVLVIGWTFAHLRPADAEVSRPDARVQAAGEAVAGTTSSYSAPELMLETGIFDERADIYSLGAILYTLLGWRPPFTDFADERHLVRHILNGDITPPVARWSQMSEGESAQHVGDGLCELAMEALSTSPARRPASVPALQAEVALWQGGLSWTELKRRRNSSRLGALLVKR